MQIVVASNVLTAGLRNNFWDTYTQMYDGVKGKISDVMNLDVTSDKLTETYGYFLSATYPRLWRRGEQITNDAFKSVSFSVTNKDWAHRITWHENDRNDDQTQSLRARAQEGGAHFALLDEEIMFQLLLGSSSNRLLDAIPNAPDGVGLFSATDGDGSNRFGVSGGNILTGSGVGTSAAIRADFFNAVELFKRFQDTEGQPLLWDSIMDQGFVIYAGVHNLQIFSEAFMQGRTVQATATGQASTGAAVSNIILDSGLRVELRFTQRIPSTDDDWFVSLRGLPGGRKPFFKQVRQPLREVIATMENSDLCRETKYEYIQWDMRAGYGISLPFGIVKVNN